MTGEQDTLVPEPARIREIAPLARVCTVGAAAIARALLRDCPNEARSLALVMQERDCQEGDLAHAALWASVLAYLE